MRHIITVFEHQSLVFNLKNDSERNLHEAFESFSGKGVPYFSLIRNGVKFNEFVGVIQVGSTLVEILPKTDQAKTDLNQEKTWRDILIGMLRAVHGFEVKSPSSSDLIVKNNSILDLYFELFINEVEYLLHRGLVKKYRKTEGNLTALKGSLQFSKQISKNIVHKERFYTKYTTYDTAHLLHVILFQTILVLKRINTNAALKNRINTLFLNFPEMPNQKITEAVFDKLILNRKTDGYKKAIEIARSILLHYHPDLSKGRNDVLALMFDMNLLWEQFVLVSIRKHLRKHGDFKVGGQNSKYFWKPSGGNRRTIRPDITISDGSDNYILDTKWKLVDKKPTMDDLRQMFAYLHYFEAEKVALFYPGGSPYVSGKFENLVNFSDKESGLLFTEFKSSVKVWQEKIGEDVKNWISQKNGN